MIYVSNGCPNLMKLLPSNVLKNVFVMSAEGETSGGLRGPMRRDQGDLFNAKCLKMKGKFWNALSSPSIQDACF